MYVYTRIQRVLCTYTDSWSIFYSPPQSHFCIPISLERKPIFHSVARADKIRKSERLLTPSTLCLLRCFRFNPTFVCFSNLVRIEVERRMSWIVNVKMMRSGGRARCIIVTFLSFFSSLILQHHDINEDKVILGITIIFPRSSDYTQNRGFFTKLDVCK